LQVDCKEFPCFLRLWNNRDRYQHWTKKLGLKEKKWYLVLKNIQTPLVEQFILVLSLLHIKLGIIKQFVKALDMDGGCIKHTCIKFSGSAIEKLISDILRTLR